MVRDVFEDSYNYMKSGTLLRQVINKINSDINLDTRAERHAFNDIYEANIKRLAKCRQCRRVLYTKARHTVYC
jgi:type I restriction enzyme M protein